MLRASILNLKTPLGGYEITDRQISLGPPLNRHLFYTENTNANSNREINGGSEDLIDSGDHSRAQTYDKRVVPAININFWNFGLFQHIVKFNFSNNCPNQK